MGKELMKCDGASGPDLNTVAAARVLVVPRVSAESRWPRLRHAARRLSLAAPAGELFCGGINSVKRIDLLLFSRNIKSLDNSIVCFH